MDPVDGSSATHPQGDGGATADGGADDGAIHDAHADGDPSCNASSCGNSVCGRSSCGFLCGSCGTGQQEGCFVGHCSTSCPGTPCVDHSGEHICEGEHGLVACEGGPHFQICTCSGGGHDAWISCGACF
jgi:hypothetical protein